MKNHRFVFLLLVSVILAVGIISIVPGKIAFAYDLHEYYPLNEGNNWTYSQTKDGNNYEMVINVSGKEMVGEVECTKIGDLVVAVDSGGIKKYKTTYSPYGPTDSSSTFYEPAMMMFPNIEVGETREYLLNSRTEDAHGVTTVSEEGTLEISLDSIEDVEVQAGKFTGCLKFSSDYIWKEKDNSTAGSHGEDKCTTWLAPGVGEVKSTCFIAEYNPQDNYKEESTVQQELISTSLVTKVIEENREPAVTEIPPQEEINQNQ